jgi:hypothetical protein
MQTKTIIGAEDRIAKLQALWEDIREQYQDIIRGKICINNEESAKANELMNHLIGIEKEINTIKILAGIPLDPKTKPESNVVIRRSETQLFAMLERAGWPEVEARAFIYDAGAEFIFKNSTRLVGSANFWAWWNHKAQHTIGMAIDKIILTGWMLNNEHISSLKEAILLMAEKRETVRTFKEKFPDQDDNY